MPFAVCPLNAASLRVIDLLDDGASIKVPHTRDSFSPVGFVFFEVKVNQPPEFHPCKRSFTGARESHGKEVLRSSMAL